MPLFWLVHEIDGKRRVFVQEAGALIFARLHASIAGFKGEFVETHTLDAKRAKRVPNRCGVTSFSFDTSRLDDRPPRLDL